MTLGEYIATLVAKAVKDVLEGDKTNWGAIFKKASEEATDDLVGDPTSMIDKITKAVGEIPLIGPVLDLPLEGVKWIEDGVGKLGMSIGHGYLIGFAGYQLGKPIFEPVLHEINALTTNEIFEAQDAARLAAKGIITQAFAESEGAGDGFDKSHMDSLIKDERRYPSLSETLDLLNRGNINRDQAVALLQLNGFPPGCINSVLDLRNALLSPADLALASLRRVITTDEMYADAKLVGFDKDKMDVLVGNTGEPPGLMQLLEAYRRGFIDQPTLTRGILQSRVRDEWIGTIEKLRYSPMTVADAVRATVEHYMTPDEGAAIAQQNGLEPAHWPFLVESWGRPISLGEMMELYNRKLVTEDQVKQAIRESDIKDKYVDIAMGLHRRLVPEYQIVNMVKEGVVTTADAVTMLKEWGYDDHDSLAFANLGAAKATTPHHTLDKSDTITMYSDGLINKAGALGYLAKLGYTPELSEEMLALARFKRKAALARVTMRGVEAEVKARKITPDAAKAQLIKAGLDADQADAEVAQWLQVRANRTRTLTQSQIIKAIKDGVVSFDSGFTSLVALGMSIDDVEVLLKVEGLLQYQPLPVPPNGFTLTPTLDGTARIAPG